LKKTIFLKKKMSIYLLVVLFLGLVFADPLPKQLAGPPSEFADHLIPDPIQAAVHQKSAFMMTDFLQDGSEEFDLQVDSETGFAFNFFSPNLKHMSLKLTDPSGNNVPLGPHQHTGYWPIGDSNIAEVPTQTYTFIQPTPGTWKLTVTARDMANATRASNYPNVAIILFNDSPLQLYSYLSSYQNEKGKQIGLVAQMTQQAEIMIGQNPEPFMGGAITAAEMEIFTPDGKEIDVPMHDDGLHGDGLANDGIYGATILASESGQYIATALLEGVNAEGHPFVRSTEHVISVVDDPIELTGSAYGVGDNNRIDMYITVNQQTSNKYRVYTEVWGTDGQGQEVAICWIESMVYTQVYENQPVVRLELDMNWVALAKAQGPYVLKNAHIQEVNTFIPVSQKSVIKVNMKADADKIVQRILAAGVPTITEEMLMGVRPPVSYFNPNNATAACNLILLHGYCSGVNPWSSSSSIFTNACYFLSPNSNDLHDAYAMKVYNAYKDVPSFGGIGHSQGGLVLLHLHNHYWSGIDNAKGNRLIQSVGSPYQGCTGAGSAANLIKIFGVACGSNNDLTVDGTKLWHVGITAEARKKVYYATTTYKQGNLFGDYCNIAVNLVLQWPNDGTTETSYATLKDGVFLGNKEKWCHTTSMSYPPQYTDADRNKDFNVNAAR